MMKPNDPTDIRTSIPATRTATALFVGEQEEVKADPGGALHGSVWVKFGSALRTSGLLLALPAEDLRALLFLLTFVGPGGRCLATLQQLARAMNVSEARTRRRMQRLAQLVWQGQALVVERTLFGTEAYAPSSVILTLPEAMPVVRSSPGAPKTAKTEASSDLASRKPAPREEVIADSRTRIGRPRATVEQNIAHQMDWDYPFRSRREQQGVSQQNRTEETTAVQKTENPAVAKVRRQLVEMGVTEEQADALLAEYEMARIYRQLDWLPHRHARNPASLLLAAIREDYEAPREWRGERTEPRSDPEATREKSSTPASQS